MTRTLVTGAGGFVGKAVLRRLALEDGEIARAMVRPGWSGASLATEVVKADLTDPSSFAAALEGVDRVIHAGARVATTGSWEEFEAANVTGTKALIEASERAGVGHFVHVSSLSVYDVPGDGVTVDEDSPLEAGASDRGFYARSKLEADKVAQEAIARGAPVTIVRPGLIFGPGRKVPLARRAVAAGPFRVVLASRDYLMPMAFVENVADGLVLASQRREAIGRIYTLVDDHVRQADYARMFRQASGESWTPVYVPPAVIRSAISIVEKAARVAGRRSPVSSHQVERTLRSARFDGSRVRAELEWHPRVPIFEALRRSFADADSRADAAR